MRLHHRMGSIGLLGSPVAEARTKAVRNAVQPQPMQQPARYSVSFAFGMVFHLPLGVLGDSSASFYSFRPVWQVSLSQTHLRKCRYAGFVRLKVCTDLPDSFFRMKGEAGTGPGLIQGGRVAGEPLENRWKTAGQTVGKTVGKTAGKLSENRRETAGKTAGKPPAKPPENRRKTPRFWVTFASLKKGREGPGRTGKGLSGVIFRALGGGWPWGPLPQAQRMYFPVRWGWWNGELRVFERDGGPFRSDGGFSEFHEEATPKGVYTDS